ncbi:hypothetical protein B0H14DRAFT_2594610 [Mycena olivaceomarginata]|nr:hypothetical protein B0H14DRAFT_2594610 [Mycena olivaceomarginata]
MLNINGAIIQRSPLLASLALTQSQTTVILGKERSSEAMFVAVNSELGLFTFVPILKNLNWCAFASGKTMFQIVHCLSAAVRSAHGPPRPKGQTPDPAGWNLSLRRIPELKPVEVECDAV